MTKVKRLNYRKIRFRPGCISVPDAISRLGDSLYPDQWSRSPASALMPFYLAKLKPELVLKRREVRLRDGEYGLATQIVKPGNISVDDIKRFNPMYSTAKGQLLDWISDVASVRGRKKTLETEMRESPNISISLAYYPALEIDPSNANILRSQALTVFTAGYVAVKIDGWKQFGLVAISEKWLASRLADLRIRRLLNDAEKSEVQALCEKIVAKIRGQFSDPKEYPLISIEEDLVGTDELTARLFGRHVYLKKASLVSFVRSLLPREMTAGIGKPSPLRREKAKPFLEAFFESRHRPAVEADEQ